MAISVCADELRQDVLSIFRAAVASVNGAQRVAGWLRENPISEPVWVVAIGKAAGAMAAGSANALQQSLRAGLIITKEHHLSQYELDAAKFQCIESGHPLPNESSLLAGQELLRFLGAVPEDAQLLFLISGGASTLVEVLPAGIELRDLIQVNEWLLCQPYPIQTINTVRKQLSCIKSGRLLHATGCQKITALMISDVMGDRPEWIGSGLCTVDAEKPALPNDLPDWMCVLLEQAKLQLPPDPAGSRVKTEIIATLASAMQAAHHHGQELGYDTYLHEEFVTGDSAATGQEIASQLLRKNKGLHVWGGETSMQLPVNHGTGGRNQHLALAAAEELAGRKGIYLLSAGTDGSDGPTGDAGALVDGGTVDRGISAGLDPVECLAAANSGAFLKESRDLITTGPTGTNVMDLVIGLKA